MPFKPEKKATLLMPSGPLDDPERRHLWIILTDPCPRDAHLLVSASTLRENRFHDPSCIIEPGEHKRIKARSWIEYRRCRAELSTALVNGEASWLYHPAEPVSDELLERICDGLYAPGEGRLAEVSFSVKS
jgi:hypothetical protein